MSAPRQQHRSPGTPRPRYGRLCAAGSAALITVVTVLAGLGVVPRASVAAASPPGERASDVAQRVAATPVPSSSAAPAPKEEPRTKAGSAPAPHTAPATGLPPRSGSGKRVVFDMSDQRVWLVDARAGVRRTYLVSGSVTDNLHPGTYAVYSASRWAVGVDDSGVMEYFVRFTRGDHAAIGFHSIPTKHGHALQTRAQLGTPRSHGCIRQWRTDARQLWDFAPVGTKVVVTA